jgi:hypothetical protein
LSALAGRSHLSGSRQSGQFVYTCSCAGNGHSG